MKLNRMAWRSSDSDSPRPGQSGLYFENSEDHREVFYP